MADPMHLERMGRELKCPICLSLFNSAVSLTCNHVFCGVCIEKSMKAASDCPVCKIPYRRREIRPAPHMDSLVSIYKSMEVASGLDMFGSQIAPSVKSPEVQKDPGNSRKECEIQETEKSVVGKKTAQECPRRSKKRGRPLKACTTTSSDSGKPSFPTKKRVHVTQYPLPETPVQCLKSTNEVGATAHSEPEKSSRLQREKLVLNENRESTLAPFFWLRDEDDADNAEHITQQTNPTAFTGSPLKLPSFDDIKALDDDSPVKATSHDTGAAPQDADFIDSEMFEWTQRPCSPELYTSPIKTQVVLVKDSYDTDIQETDGCASLDGATTLKLGFDNEILMNEKEEGNANLVYSYSRMKKTVTEKNIKTLKSDKGIKKKRKNKDKVAVGVATSSIKPLRGAQLVKRKSENCGNGSCAVNECGKPSSEVHTNTKVRELTPEVAPKVNDAVCLNAASDSKVYKESSMLKKNGTTIKKQRSFHSKTDTPKADEHQMIQESTSLVAEISSADKTLVSDEGMMIRKCQDNKKVKNKEPKRVRFSKDGTNQDDLVDNHQLLGVNSKATTEEAQKLEVSKSISRDRDSSSKEAKRAKSLLHKGDTAPNNVECAFCHSAEESEVTGTMVHYLQGKPIVGDQAQGLNIIHCHKNCTEWAPNVFFQDDVAINLESELTRSRRITCVLCGSKGAALGCYQKSCRKSFHVPCALMTPECRWDNDNFVMLCPLHASCNLPCELPDLQSSQKKKAAPKRNSGIQKEVSKDDLVCSQWKSHMESKNLVLCCSGLIDAEKEVVSQFDKISEVKILKNWDPNVTHIIASTNKDGACKRTLKVLMGILEGKWILTIEWVKACVASMELVNEQPYEVNVETHGVRNGPSLGRSRVLAKKPKLFDGLKFYFTGDFEASYKRFLQDLVIAGGGTVLQRKPLSEDRETDSPKRPASTTYIIYNLELPQNCKPSKICSIADRRRSDAEAIASSTRAKTASNAWILDSIAGCKLQSLTT